jgi:hypothetical protein
MMGNKPYPTVRDGADLRENRKRCWHSTEFSRGEI